MLIENNDLFRFGTWLLILLPVIILHLRRWYEILQTRNLSMTSLWYWGPPLDYFQVEWFNEVRICSLLFVFGHFVVVLGCFMSLEVVSGRFLHVVCRFRSFLVRCRSFQVVIDLLRLFLARCRSFQVVWSF